MDPFNKLPHSSSILNDFNALSINGKKETIDQLTKIMQSQCKQCFYDGKLFLGLGNNHLTSAMPIFKIGEEFPRDLSHGAPPFNGGFERLIIPHHTDVIILDKDKLSGSGGIQLREIEYVCNGTREVYIPNGTPISTFSQSFIGHGVSSAVDCMIMSAGYLRYNNHHEILFRFQPHTQLIMPIGTKVTICGVESETIREDKIIINPQYSDFEYGKSA